MVAPLIFIAFVENAFKHSGIDFDPEGFIQIFLSFRSGVIFFSTENSIPAGGVAGKTGGVGLPNARSRLELMYPGKINLDIKQTDLVYAVPQEVAPHPGRRRGRSSAVRPGVQLL
jgi:LytS/YehU family sensor histidine kinase